MRGTCDRTSIKPTRLGHEELESRRRWLQAAGVSLSWPTSRLLAAPVSSREPRTPSPIRAVIQIFYYGGPSHLDTYDLKPNAPSEIRGEFQPISTSAPGLQISEHLPYMSRVMHHCAVIRSLHHQSRLHDAASIHTLTGRQLDGPDRELFNPLPQFYPSFGSMLAYARRDQRTAVPFASLPFPFRNVHEVPCQGAGFLGSDFDPLRIDVLPQEQRYEASHLRPAEALNEARLRSRQQLLNELDAGQHALSRHYQRAYELLGSRTIQEALEIDREPVAMRERYGYGPVPGSMSQEAGGDLPAALGFANEMRGQNLLLARRLVEAGVPYVTVYDHRQQGRNWDAHVRCGDQHKSYLLPPTDRALATLIEDLQERGLLESTLILACGEFGRTPHINGNAGRDHWPDCFSAVLAGAGITGGTTYGSSDGIGAYPETDPVTPGDLAATLLWRFGIDHEQLIHDRLNRPHPMAVGKPLMSLFT